MRDRPLIDARFHDTYRMAGFVRSVLQSPFGDYLHFVSDFFVDDAWTGTFARPYPESTALHHFVDYAVRHVYYAENVEGIDLGSRKRAWSNYGRFAEALERARPHVLPVEEAFEAYEIEEDSFIGLLREQGRGFGEATDDDLFDHYQQLTLGQPFEDLVRRVTDEVLHVLFSDREALMLFNLLVARRVVSETDPQDLDTEGVHYFEAPGRLRRVRPPRWVQRTVFFRDRGRCVLCRRDLSGLISFGAENVENYDHVVPLSHGGLNDLTNVQLLCAGCNLEKGDRTVTTSSIYDSWAPTAPTLTP